MSKYRIIEAAHGKAREARAGARLQSYELGEGEWLTKRQLEVLHLVTKGLTNKQIAQRLWLAEETIKYHMKNIYDRAGLNSVQNSTKRTALAVWAVQNCVFEEES